jgi:pimeloyl-ACP methyl ester carboxylesterase
MDALGIGRAHVAGNSMGGRVAIELGLRHPERVGGLALLCPAVAFVKRTYHPLVRVVRPELGLLPHRLARERVAEHLWSLFADPDALDPSVADVVVDEFQRIYSTPGGRIAFLASARNIYLDAPFGRNGFYGRLSQLEAPALFVWGSHDTIIPPAFGHVPQVECAAQCSGLLERFFGRIDALAPPAVARVRQAA